VIYCVDPHSETPPSRQLVEAVLDAMARGELVAGARLPSIRALASEALVNPNTVGKAYRELEHMRVVLGRNGSGVFVTEEGEEIARSHRREATLASFEKSVRGALLAGHDDAQLRSSLQEILAEAMRLVDEPEPATTHNGKNGNHGAKR
jgi:DNA-binding transcriptional regulator YhcF (GntR family)